MLSCELVTIKIINCCPLYSRTHCLYCQPSIGVPSVSKLRQPRDSHTFCLLEGTCHNLIWSPLRISLIYKLNLDGDSMINIEDRVED
jgi:hypothetical protein